MRPFSVEAVTALVAVLLYVVPFCIAFAEVLIKEDLGLTDRHGDWDRGRKNSRFSM